MSLAASNFSPGALPSQLAAGAGVQGELLRVEDLPDSFYHEDENPGMGVPTYTAERFFTRRREDYERCVALLAGGLGLLKIARLLRVHHMTVAAVRDRESGAIDIQKEKIRQNIRTAVGIAAERLPDIMATLAGNQVPLATAILIDKLAQLDGEPTQRVEVTHRGHLTHEAVAADLTAFPDAIEIETVMGSGAGAPGQKAIGSAVPVVVVEGSARVPVSDVQSASKPT